MGDLDKTSIIILVCVLTAAVIIICLIAIIVYRRKKWCRKSEDQPKINASISISDIHEYDDEDELKGLTGDSDDEHMRVHSSSDANGARGAYRGSPYFHSGDADNEEPPRTEQSRDADNEKPPRVEQSSDADNEEPPRTEQSSDADNEEPPRTEQSSDADNEEPPRTEQSSERRTQPLMRVEEISDIESREVRTRRFGERCSRPCPICDRLYSKDAQQLSVDTLAILQDQPILWAPPPPPDPPNPQ